MPRKEIDYSKIVIYKIVCNDLNITDLYVGSTTNFTKRKNSHKGHTNGKFSKILNEKKYQTIRDNGGWENWSMIQIEEYPCKNGNEAKTRERYWVEELQSKLNVIKPIRTADEIKEYHKEYHKEYNKANKDIIKERRRERYERNKDIVKEQGLKYREDNREKIREYRQANKDRLREAKKEYLERNKQIIKEKKKLAYQANKAKQLIEKENI